MAIKKDIWRTGLCFAPVDDIVTMGGFSGFDVTWLPDMPRSYQFRADPFGLRLGDSLHLFSEVFDYRDRHGRIEWAALDAKGRVIESRIVLEKPWHLSYPQVFASDGEIWMLPEAFQSGKLTLYRARTFPDEWEATCDIALGEDVAIDATMLNFHGMWWLFYTPLHAVQNGVNALHCAYANRLTGHWTRHAGNPIRVDHASARPGGMAVEIDGQVMLPVQDCVGGYGRGIRPLWFDSLSPASVKLSCGPRLNPAPGFAPYLEGLHTLSACGDLTFFDVKKRTLSPNLLIIEARRALRNRAAQRSRNA